jgi:hypothetical protein
MDKKKILLATLVALSGLFQFAAGIWMIVDIKSAGQMLLGIKFNAGIISSKDYFIISQIAAKAFLMLSVYSILTVYLIVKNNIIGYYLSLSTGIMIALIAITTYIDTGSYLVWITDFSRGLLITAFSILFLRTRESIKVTNSQTMKGI